MFFPQAHKPGVSCVLLKRRWSKTHTYPSSSGILLQTKVTLGWLSSPLELSCSFSLLTGGKTCIAPEIGFLRIVPGLYMLELTWDRCPSWATPSSSSRKRGILFSTFCSSCSFWRDAVSATWFCLNRLRCCFKQVTESFDWVIMGGCLLSRHQQVDCVFFFLLVRCFALHFMEFFLVYYF